jgi:hypothetical protein
VGFETFKSVTMASTQENVTSTPAHDDRIDNAEKQQTTLEHAEFTGKTLNEDARMATQTEHTMPLWQGIKTYRKAVFWSVIVSSSIIMEGYDTTLIGSFYGYPAFREKFGTWNPGPAGWQLSGPWQAGISDIQAGTFSRSTPFLFWQRLRVPMAELCSKGPVCGPKRCQEIQSIGLVLNLFTSLSNC